MNISASTRQKLRRVPNALTGARIAAVPVLIALAATRHEAAFTWVLVPALLSDIADGWMARALSLQSKIGAALDSIADTLLWFASVYGIWVFHPDVITGNAWLCCTVIGLWASEYLLALLRYGRVSSFHTYAAKIAGYALGIFIGVLFVFGYFPWLLYLAAGLSVAGNLEEFALLAVLPEWRADVRGLWWVLDERRNGRLT